jgi:hypothetical protein
LSKKLNLSQARVRITVSLWAFSTKSL